MIKHLQTAILIIGLGCYSQTLANESMQVAPFKSHTMFHSMPMSQPDKATSATPVTPPDKSKVSYALGVAVAADLMTHKVELEYNSFMKGLQDKMSSQHLRMSEQAIQTTLTNYKNYLAYKEHADLDKIKLQNEQEAEKFLIQNKTKPDVKSFPDGLQYKVLTEGNGIQAAENDFVTVAYSGKTLNGNEFDSSEKHGKPLTMRLQRLLPGWKEALKNMKVGSTWELYIPGKMAYGDRGVPPVIGPNQMLIYKLTLLDVKKTTNKFNFQKPSESQSH